MHDMAKTPLLKQTEEQMETWRLVGDMIRIGKTPLVCVRANPTFFIVALPEHQYRRIIGMGSLYHGEDSTLTLTFPITGEMFIALAPVISRHNLVFFEIVGE